jgi:hypothetical protein
MSILIFVSSMSITQLTDRVLFVLIQLFARQMFVKLNPRWAATLLGFIALLMAPIPLLFVRYGPYLRSISKNMPAESKIIARPPPQRNPAVSKEPEV